ncbi:hypothetical protein [Alteromonas sp. KUL150]|uniref:hypothetical protein n=1 Tax=unclassified Alteromonas TaxID=2614992 RepID=UPI0035A7263A
MSVTEAIEAIKRFNANKPAVDRNESGSLPPQVSELPSSAIRHLYEQIAMLEKEVTELKQIVQQLVNEKR